MRVLKPGGKLVIIAEMYKRGKYDRLKWSVMWLLGSSHLGVSDHRELFASAGYVNVEIFEENTRGWICAVAGEPAQKRRNFRPKSPWSRVFELNPLLASVDCSGHSGQERQNS